MWSHHFFQIILGHSTVAAKKAVAPIRVTIGQGGGAFKKRGWSYNQKYARGNHGRRMDKGGHRGRPFHGLG